MRTAIFDLLKVSMEFSVIKTAHFPRFDASQLLVQTFRLDNTLLYWSSFDNCLCIPCLLGMLFKICGHAQTDVWQRLNHEWSKFSSYEFAWHFCEESYVKGGFESNYIIYFLPSNIIILTWFFSRILQHHLVSIIDHRTFDHGHRCID
jgi:hypothetical protein